MLALLAGLLLPPGSPLPSAYLPTSIRPIISVNALRGQVPFQVTRGSRWRQGGLVRLSYFYKFPTGTGPELPTILKESKFVEDGPGFSMLTGPRVAREVDGVRQTIQIMDVKAGELRGWANIKGPMRLCLVTEMPLYGVQVKRWHDLPHLKSPPVPPGFPSDLECISDATIDAVDSDPLIPRGFRTATSTMVTATVPRVYEEVVAAIKHEFGNGPWRSKATKSDTTFGRLVPSYGLSSVQVLKETDPKKDSLKTVVRLTYNFQDTAHSPRIE